MEVDMQSGPSHGTVCETQSVFFQSQASLSPDPHTGMLWRLPTWRNSAPKAKPRDPDSYGVGFVYSKCCKLMARNWKVDEGQDYIPAELRETTPYSLALLVALRMLSSHSKRQREKAHEQLLAAVNKRLRVTADISESQWRGSSYPDMSDETSIQERIDGLMVTDVQATTEYMREVSHNERKAEKDMLYRGEQQKEQARALERVMNRRRDRQNAQIELQRELWTEQTHGLELVDIEWAGGDQPMLESEGVASSEGQEARLQRKRHLRDFPTPESIAQDLHNDLMVLKNSNPPSKRLTRRPRHRPGFYASREALQASTLVPYVPANTMTETLQTEDASGSDSDDGVKLRNHEFARRADALEPTSISKADKRDDGVMKNLLGGMKVTVAACQRPRKERQSNRRQEKLRRRVAEKSTRLPSEKMDFGALGSLEGDAERKKMLAIMGAFDGLGVNAADHTKGTERRQLDDDDEEEL